MKKLTIGLVAHDAKKDAMCGWTTKHKAHLDGHSLFGTGTTGSRITEATGLDVTCLKSGPLGGDQQLGSMICEEALDALIFLIDPLSPHPHDVDIKALIRLATLYNIPYACNESTASLIIESLCSE